MEIVETRPRVDEDLPGRMAPPSKRGGGRLRRALVLAGRVILWAAILVLAVRGGVSTVAELAAGSQPPAPPVGEVEATETFPVEAARAFATRFTQDYLTFDSARDRQARLAAYALPARDRQLGWDGVGEQGVLAVVAVDVAVVTDDRASVVVAAQVTGPRWLHLAVPVATDGAGGLVVPEHPAFVAAPRVAAAPPAPDAPVDNVLGRELAPVLESFFDAYAASRADDLGYYLPVGRTLDGLDGVVELDELVELEVAEGADLRSATATVRWRDATTGAGLTQRYELVLTNDAGRWYVDQLGGAGEHAAAAPDAAGERNDDGNDDGGDRP